jgi:hypothetical protein
MLSAGALIVFSRPLFFSYLVVLEGDVVLDQVVLDQQLLDNGRVEGGQGLAVGRVEGGLSVGDGRRGEGGRWREMEMREVDEGGSASFLRLDGRTPGTRTHNSYSGSGRHSKGLLSPSAGGSLGEPATAFALGHGRPTPESTRAEFAWPERERRRRRRRRRVFFSVSHARPNPRLWHLQNSPATRTTLRRATARARAGAGAAREL